MEMAPKTAARKPGTQAAKEPTPRQAAAHELAKHFPASRIGGEFGGGSLTISGKVFCFTSSNDRVAMKLPEQRIDTLVATTGAERLTMGKRTMREWVVVTGSTSPATLQLVQEALTYVKSLPADVPKKRKK
jgi:hypothetical protein